MSLLKVLFILISQAWFFIYSLRAIDIQLNFDLNEKVHKVVFPCENSDGSTTNSIIIDYSPKYGILLAITQANNTFSAKYNLTANNRAEDSIGFRCAGLDTKGNAIVSNNGYIKIDIDLFPPTYLGPPKFFTNNQNMSRFDLEFKRYNRSYWTIQFMSLPDRGILFFDGTIPITGNSYTASKNPIIPLLYTPISNIGPYTSLLVVKMTDNFNKTSGDVSLPIYVQAMVTCESSKIKVREDLNHDFRLAIIDMTFGNKYELIIASLTNYGYLSIDGVRLSTNESYPVPPSSSSINVIYTPNPDFYGADSFEYQFYDTNLNYKSKNCKVDITVENVPDLPTLTPEFQSLFLANDSLDINFIMRTDMDVENILFTVKNAPVLGSWYMVNGDGSEGPKIFGDPNFKEFKPLFSSRSSLYYNFTIRVSDFVVGRTSYPFANFTLQAREKTGKIFQSFALVTIYRKCDTGYVTNIWSDGPSCIKCPLGAVCSELGDVFPFSDNGYYFSNGSFIACAPSEACLQKNLCGKGYEGLRCGQCAQDYYRSGVQCSQCNRISIPKNPTSILAIGLLVMLLFLSIAYHFRDANLGFASLLITYLQALSIYRLLKLQWPPIVTSFFNIFSFMNLKLEYLQPDCYMETPQTSYILKYKATMAIPLALGVVTFVVVLVLRFLNWIASLLGSALSFTKNPDNEHEKEEEEDDEGSKSGISIGLLKSFMLILDFLYFNLAETSLELFDCTMLGNINYYEAQPDRICYQSWWFELLPFSVVGLVFYTFGIPFISALIYAQRQRTLAIPPGNRTFIQKTILSLTFERNSSFKPGLEYWKTVITMRKLCIVAVKMFFTNYVHFQAIMFILIFFIFFWIHNNYNPYEIESLNQLERMVLASSIIILLGGIMSKMGDGLTKAQQNILAGAIIGTVCLCTLIVIIYAIRQFNFNLRLWKEQKEISKHIAAGTLRKGSRPGSIKLASQKSSKINESRPSSQQVFQLKQIPQIE